MPGECGGAESDHEHDLDLKPPNKIILYISCQKLPRMDSFSLTDPFCKMYIREDKTPMPPWNYVGKTETLYDNNDPEFTRSFTVNYYFEKK